MFDFTIFLSSFFLIIFFVPAITTSLSRYIHFPVSPLAHSALTFIIYFFLTLSLTSLFILLYLQFILMAETRTKGTHKINRNVECNIQTIIIAYCASASQRNIKRDLRNFQLAEIRATKGCIKVYLTNRSSEGILYIVVG